MREKRFIKIILLLASILLSMSGCMMFTESEIVQLTDTSVVIKNTLVQKIRYPNELGEKIDGVGVIYSKNIEDLLYSDKFDLGFEAADDSLLNEFNNAIRTYDVSQNYTITDDFDPDTIDVFGRISGLEPETTYYARLYFYSSGHGNIGYSVSEGIEFKTLPEVESKVPLNSLENMDFIMYDYDQNNSTGEASTTRIDLQAKLTISSKVLEKTINGSTINVDMDVAPYIVDGRTMVPIRFVAEALGFEVEWNGDTETVFLRDKNTTIEIPIKTNRIIVNGNTYESDVAPIIEEGRTFLSIGYAARALGLEDGADLIWNEELKEVIVKRTIE